MAPLSKIVPISATQRSAATRRRKSFRFPLRKEAPPPAVEQRSDFRYEERPRSGILKKFRPRPLGIAPLSKTNHLS
jgi:hypothetical protein